MRRLTGLGTLCAAALAASCALASVASAEPPDMGRCVSQAGGKYTNNVCTTLAKGKTIGKYEWEPGAIKNKFKGTGGTATLETIKKVKVSCLTEASNGEFTGPKTVGNIHVTFTGCESVGYKCSTVGSAEGEIVTNPLAGTLVWEKFGTKGGTKVAIDLVPQSGKYFVEFACGPASAKVEGSVMTNIPAGKVETTFEEKFKATKGKQKPEYYYLSKTEKVKDVLISKIGGPGAELEQSGQTVTNDQTDEEPLEVNIKA